MDFAFISSQSYLNIGIQNLIYFWKKNQRTRRVKIKKGREGEIIIKKDGRWVKVKKVRIIESEKVIISKIVREEKERRIKKSRQSCQQN